MYVERKNGASPKILGENFYKTTVATPKLTIDLLMENFLLISSFPSSPLIFSTSLTWFSLYFIYFSATPYSTATTATTKKAIDYRIQLLCSICSHVRSIFLTSRPSLTHHQKNIIRFLTHFHNYTQLFTLPSSPQDLARTHTMRRWTDSRKNLSVFRWAICYVNSFYDRNNRFNDLVTK